MVIVTMPAPRIEAFSDDAAHALRTPLTIVRGHLQLLEDDPAERAETLRLVIDELDRMGRLIDDLLLLARVDEPDFLRVDRVALGELTNEICIRSEHLGPRHWRLDDLAVVEVAADRGLLMTAMLNLARNAVDHTEPGSEIGIGSAADDREVSLWVRDNGCGVAPGDESRIFERFARGSGARRKSGGVGLGLTVARAIAGAHGGRIELGSRPGAGATFTVIVPRGGSPR
jgi:signal transduction histidine kinase